MQGSFFLTRLWRTRVVEGALRVRRAASRARSALRSPTHARPRGARGAGAFPVFAPCPPVCRRPPSALPALTALIRVTRVISKWCRLVTSAMIMFRCALVAALIAVAAAAWQENVRPKVFAQLGESTKNPPENVFNLGNAVQQHT